MKVIRDGDDRIVAGGVEWRTQRDMLGILETEPKVQAWRIGSRYTTLRLPSGRVFRKLFEPAKKLEEVIHDLVAREMGHSVSSWGGVWRQWSVFPPKTPEAIAAAFDAVPTAPRGPQDWEPDLWVQKPHAWIEQRRIGPREGAWTEWDIRSAYTWASIQGLPDLACLDTPSKSNRNRIHEKAIYLVSGVVSEWRDVEPHILPTWLRARSGYRAPIRDLFTEPEESHSMSYWVPGETLNRLDLSPKKVLMAYEWRRRKDFRKIFDEIRTLLPRWWKNVYRSHWGDWGGAESPIRESWENGVRTSCNEMPTGLRSPLWSWMVLSRVADRMSPLADQAARIFTDSVVLPDEFPLTSQVGEEVGDWQIKDRWSDGILIEPLPARPRPAAGAGGAKASREVKKVRHGSQEDDRSIDEIFDVDSTGWTGVRL